MSEGEAAAAWYVEAIALIGRTPLRTELARAHLLYARTVEWHLRKVYSQLGITSRKQLRSALRHGGLTLANT